jgi:hypothetical protein
MRATTQYEQLAGALEKCAELLQLHDSGKLDAKIMSDLRSKAVAEAKATLESTRNFRLLDQGRALAKQEGGTIEYVLQLSKNHPGKYKLTTRGELFWGPAGNHHEVDQSGWFRFIQVDRLTTDAEFAVVLENEKSNLKLLSEGKQMDESRPPSKYNSITNPSANLVEEVKRLRDNSSKHSIDVCLHRSSMDDGKCDACPKKDLLAVRDKSGLWEWRRFTKDSTDYDVFFSVFLVLEDFQKLAAETTHYRDTYKHQFMKGRYPEPTYATDPARRPGESAFYFDNAVHPYRLLCNDTEVSLERAKRLCPVNESQIRHEYYGTDLHDYHVGMAMLLELTSEEDAVRNCKKFTDDFHSLAGHYIARKTPFDRRNPSPVYFGQVENWLEVNQVQKIEKNPFAPPSREEFRAAGDELLQMSGPLSPKMEI